MQSLCRTFQDALGVKIFLDLLNGLWSYGGLKLRGSGWPQILAPPSGETMRQTPNVLEVQEREVLYHHAKFGGSRISPAAGVGKNVELFCLFVCLFVRHAFERQRLCARFRHEGVGVQKRF